jgi:hypothetical protein
MKKVIAEKEILLSVQEKEKFFQFLENDSKFFKEVFDAMFSIVTSDPILTYQVADLVEADYRNLYTVFMKKIIAEKAALKDTSCCREA